MQEITHIVQQLIEEKLAKQTAHCGDQIGRRYAERQRSSIRILDVTAVGCRCCCRNRRGGWYVVSRN